MSPDGIITFNRSDGTVFIGILNPLDSRIGLSDGAAEGWEGELSDDNAIGEFVVVGEDGCVTRYFASFSYTPDLTRLR